MKNFKTIRKIENESLEILTPVLKKFLLLNQRIASHWRWKDFPWWYNERATLSVLAAAVWKSRGIAFEEYSADKITKPTVQLKRKAVSRGRNDLYISLKGKIYIVEAKNLFVPGFGDSTYDKIAERLKKARKDVKRDKKSRGHRLAILFVVPYFDWSQKDIIDLLIEKFIDQINRVHPTAAAWIFPADSRISARWRKKHIYPGVAILIKKVR